MPSRVSSHSFSGEAMKLLQRTKVDATLVVAGSGPDVGFRHGSCGRTEKLLTSRDLTTALTVYGGGKMRAMDTDLSKTSATSAQLTAFVDAGVIAAYLTGSDGTSRLFDDGYRGRVRFAVDPVVLQEILTLPQIQESPQLLETVKQRLNFEILPLDIDRARELVGRAKALRNRVAHSSGILIAASADDCDYLITYDRGLKELITGDRPRVVTPEEFTSLVATS